MMNKEEIIYPSMVIRSQSEAIKLLEKQNKDLQQRIDKIDKYTEDRISTLTVSIDNKAKDQYFNNKCIFCNSAKNILEFMDKKICKKCINKF